MSNRLSCESSPYLLQHAENPVDWYPWSEEALEKAKVENKPIFLSIGYSACHWCHVMEHESFENPEIARVLNENFVSIKVDREERPDIDQVYMQAVMALRRGQGGWPLSAFLTPDQDVFFGGTYWPPSDSRGLPGFQRVLAGVLDAFRNRRDEVDLQSRKVTRYLNEVANGEEPDRADEMLKPALVEQVGEALERMFDFQHGGFGRAPKFPHSMDLQVLMRLEFQEKPGPESAREKSRWMKMVCLHLDKMALGGIYDHLGGGFARYSVDEQWLVPHFEKMLYDNGLLMDAYLDALSLTGKRLYADRATETFDYQIRQMTDPGGAYHSTEDADSEGVEGKHYVWSVEAIHEVLGPDRGELFCQVYGVTRNGNFEGSNVLNLKKELEECAWERSEDPAAFCASLATCRSELFSARQQRIRPGKDDKILTGWNGLMIQAMARGGMILQRPDYLESAVAAATFIDSRMRQPDGIGLFHTSRQGVAKIDAYLDDYSYFINALVTLYEATAEPSWLQRAVELADLVIREFHDPVQGGFFFAARSTEQLIAPSKEFQDSSVPSGNSMMVTALARLFRLNGRQEFREVAWGTARKSLELILRSPTAAGQMVCGIDRLVAPSQEVVVCASPEDRTEIVSAIFARYHPNRNIAHAPSDSGNPFLAPELLAGKSMVNGKPTVYICEGYRCSAPLVGISAIRDHFSDNGSAIG
ncbi:MAG: thioredoxin domain-containing protein [Planctomycetota bacterium]|nr:thioredoxin domain-containing protein [Planctomycetota bacterium]